MLLATIARLINIKAMSYYHLLTNLPVTILNPFNTFGPDILIVAVNTNLISRINSSNKIKIGNTKPTRDFFW